MRRQALRLGVSDSTKAAPVPADVYDPAAEEVTTTVWYKGELRSATLSRDGLYRYRLTRRWADGPALAWLLQNPSKADWVEDDQTVLRCRTFSKAAGYAALEVVNLWAWRETESDVFKAVLRDDPKKAEGPGNAGHILAAWVLCPALVVAFGAGMRESRNGAESRLFDLMNEPGGIPVSKVRVLGLTKDGSPLHPSRLGNDRRLTEWDPWGQGFLLPF